MLPVEMLLRVVLVLSKSCDVMIPELGTYPPPPPAQRALPHLTQLAPSVAGDPGGHTQGIVLDWKGSCKGPSRDIWQTLCPHCPLGGRAAPVSKFLLGLRACGRPQPRPCERCSLRFSGAQGHDVCNLLSNVQQRNSNKTCIRAESDKADGLRVSHS